MHKKMQFDLPLNVKDAYNNLDEVISLYGNGDPNTNKPDPIQVRLAKERLNGLLERLSDDLVSDFGGDCDITWCSDGTIIVTTASSDAVIDQTVAKRGLGLKDTCRSDIKHRADINGDEPDFVELTGKDGKKNKVLVKRGGVIRKKIKDLTKDELDAVNALEKDK